MDIQEIVREQRAFYETGATRSLAFRLDALKKLQAALRANEDALAGALRADLGKQPFESYMCETGIVLDELRYHIRHLARWMRPRAVATPLAQFSAKSFTSPEPYGVALIMAPWNYPVQLCLDPLVGAISGGNCAVVKPSAYAPNVSRALAKLLADTFPPSYIAAVEGGREQNTALLSQRFDYIFFTGSVAVGKVVMEAASKYLTPVTLELGGKSPVIIDATADLRLAARRVAFGKVLNAGQTCVGPDYVLIDERVRDAFIGHYKEALDAFFPGGDRAGMVTIVSEKHYAEKKALLEGQRAVIGGGCDDARRFIEPTVLVDVDPASPVMQQEIFGPILPVLTWKTLDEAIGFVRGREKPLALYLFTADRETERRVLDRCSFGGGCINDTIIHLATSNMGFGGVGMSGMGQYHGKLSFDTFTHSRSIVRKATWIDLPMRYFPYTEKNFRLLRKFLK
ncbi:MAG: aldehyde dehydrogenase [Oscillospiraceae bacterium]|nr:aldehyde dehydrogenase [Oscillospiraceae bacterium]